MRWATVKAALIGATITTGTICTWTLIASHVLRGKAREFGRAGSDDLDFIRVDVTHQPDIVVDADIITLWSVAVGKRLALPLLGSLR